MQVIGIIAEYNPLHLGHIYQIKKIKEQFPESLIILITNSCFTQRGDVSIINKWDKTKIALNNNIDLVVELPFAFASQSADIFAKGALEILNKLQIDTLVFGSESNDITKLKTIVKTQLENPEYDIKVKEYLKMGLNYPTAQGKALTSILGYTTSSPNDLLGISYIKEIEINKYPITPVSIQRIGSYHETKVTNNIISASLIRTLLREGKDISNHIPPNTYTYLYKNISRETYFSYLKYKILSTTDLTIYQTVEEGIENRIKKAITISNSWEELVQNIKTKRYTHNKINRMLIHILTSFTKEEAKKLTIDYIRILGFNLKGQIHLNKIKKDIDIPIITNYKKNISPLLDLEHRITTIYNIPFSPTINQNESKRKPIINISASTDILQIHPNNETTDE